MTTDKLIPEDPEDFEDWAENYFKVNDTAADEYGCEYDVADQVRGQLILVFNEMLDMDIESGSPISDILYFGACAVADAVRERPHRVIRPIKPFT